MARTSKQPPVAATTEQPPRAATTDPVEAYSLDADPERATRQLPQLESGYPFLLAYHPARWAVIEGRCIPALGRVTLAPGMEGCTWVGGRPRWREPATKWADRGWTVIPHAWGPGGSYVRRVAVAGGHAYLTQWETPHAGASTVRSDVPGYAAWIGSLVDEGKLPEPELWALERLADKTRERVETLSRELGTTSNPAAVRALTARVERARADLEAVEAVIADVASQAVPVDGDAVVLD
ncbi:MAG: hypothetical protein H6733_10190 [Alphaproteobacteria bacterium]|nr:hypothetical protein [Alphaproteobacteria bacterium]